uniref:Putative cytochrome p450 n=1 Tax=Culex tarsalis TaxID=7177 RepID=A0A1Q3FIT7_CULTA
MTLLNTLLYLVLPAVALSYLFIRRKFSYWADRNVPHAPGSFPLGSLQGMGSKYHMTQIFERIYQQFKNVSPAAGFYLTMRPTLMVTDLELVKQILVKDFNSFRDRGMFYNEQDDPVSAHLFAIDGEKWRFLRNKLSPTFTSGKIKYMFHTMQEIGEQFVQCFERYVERGESVDAKALCTRFTCDVVGSCAFGLNCNSLKNEGSELINIANRLFKPSPIDAMWQFFFMSFKDLAVKLRMSITPRDVSKYFMKLIPETVTYREKNNVTRPDFLQLLIQLKNKGTVDGAEQEASSETLTMNQVVAQSFVFMLGGFETSSTALTFALFDLANNPEIQEKTRNEITAVLKRHDGKITYEAIKDMTYLEQVVNETLRMHPPVPFIARNANHAYRLTNPDVTLEADTMVMVPVYAIHSDPDIYPNPSRFDPDRFTPEAVQARHSHAFLPFGDGPRNCIGLRFALLEVKFAIAVLLCKFRFATSARMTLPLELDISAPTMVAKGGVWLDVKRVNPIE